LILIAIALPSFALLYAMDDVGEPTLTIKVVGHQWYWSYEIVTMDSDFATLSTEDNSDFIGPRRPSRAEIETAVDAAAVELTQGVEEASIPTAPANELVKKAFDSYMVLEEDLKLGQHRLLEVDNQLYLPS